MAQIDTLTNVGAVVSTDLALILRGGANVLGTLGNMVGQSSSAVTISGGTIDGTAIGGTTAAAAAFAALNATTGTFSGALDVTGVATFSSTVSAAAGVYVGGTAAANLLDDYEEGTWTPTQGTFTTWTSPTFIATYTKVGRLIVANLRQTGGTIAASTAAKYLGGLPFSAAQNAMGSVSDGSITDYGNCVVSTSNVYFTNIIASETDLIMTVTYYVA